jgi:hypothetical protein
MRGAQQSKFFASLFFKKASGLQGDALRKRPFFFAGAFFFGPSASKEKSE